ncbi:short chain oxidoreductase [Stereum hirsutum FP-91666 SS1]|uniref:short chain oxidoreductase n=1 Tax=Stereum hirsutum (strain FP-91666) TaxID=721885 RepID=UPI000444A722|nr:short chain oxidoreductase [Stereum hirsutum FP-91666 SS1]EIM86249.1 short chain oxidoreductase [Stereum hirsutum FP-91666 SS1]
MSSDSKIGHVALVTGAAQGIGRSIALRLAKDGCDLAVNDIPGKIQELIALQAEIKGQHSRRCVVVTGDVSVEDDVRKVFEEVVAQLGGLDIMVANAGICAIKPFVDISVNDLDKMFAVNLRGVFLCYQFAARQMIKQGRGGKIIGASSEAGKQGHPLMTSYCAMKFAVRGLTQAVATELGAHNINVNAYAPGVILTDMQQAIANHKPDPDAFLNEESNKPALRRNGTAEDVASVVSYLASENSGYITGTLSCIS